MSNGDVREAGHEDARKVALDKLMECGEVCSQVQFENRIVGGLRPEIRAIYSLSPTQGSEDIEKELMAEVNRLKSECFALGLTQEDINQYSGEWKRAGRDRAFIQSLENKAPSHN